MGLRQTDHPVIYGSMVASLSIWLAKIVQLSTGLTCLSSTINPIFDPADPGITARYLIRLNAWLQSSYFQTLSPNPLSTLSSACPERAVWYQSIPIQHLASHHRFRDLGLTWNPAPTNWAIVCYFNLHIHQARHSNTFFRLHCVHSALLVFRMTHIPSPRG